MDDILSQLERMSLAQSKKKTKPKRKNANNSLDIADNNVFVQPVPERRMLRASRSRAVPDFVLPLENTPSIASELEGKDIIHNMKNAIKLHRDIRVQLPVMKDAVLKTPALFFDNRFADAEKVLREYAPTFKKLERVYEDIMYVRDGIAPLRELVEKEDVQTNNPDKRMRLTKLRSYLLKHNQECQKILEDATTYFPPISAVYSKRSTMLEEARQRVQSEKEIEKSKKRFKNDLESAIEMIEAFSIKGPATGF